jgi:hypothetical protein
MGRRTLRRPNTTEKNEKVRIMGEKEKKIDLQNITQTNRKVYIPLTIFLLVDS